MIVPRYDSFCIQECGFSLISVDSYDQIFVRGDDFNYLLIEYCHLTSGKAIIHIFPSLMKSNMYMQFIHLSKILFLSPLHWNHLYIFLFQSFFPLKNLLTIYYLNLFTNFSMVVLVLCCVLYFQYFCWIIFIASVSLIKIYFWCRTYFLRF